MKYILTLLLFSTAFAECHNADGRYYQDGTICIASYMEGYDREYIFNHEYAHKFEFEVLPTFERKRWHALIRSQNNPYCATEYGYASSGECLAEVMMAFLGYRNPFHKYVHWIGSPENSKEWKRVEYLLNTYL